MVRFDGAVAFGATIIIIQFPVTNSAICPIACIAKSATRGDRIFTDPAASKAMFASVEFFRKITAVAPTICAGAGAILTPAVNIQGPGGSVCLAYHARRGIVGTTIEARLALAIIHLN